jgi:hypothetical protein
MTYLEQEKQQGKTTDKNNTLIIRTIIKTRMGTIITVAPSQEDVSAFMF